MKKLDSSQQYRTDLFHAMFPPKIKNEATIDWLYKVCTDGKDVVAPRDIIELLREAKRVQFNQLRHNQYDQQWLLSPEALIQGFIQMSKNKRDIFLKAEFYHLYDDIVVFDQGKTEHGEKSLKSLLGKDWLHKVKSLESIGFLRIDRPTRSWVIPHIYRPCLGLNNVNT